jgi:hypothetical protein
MVRCELCSRSVSFKACTRVRIVYVGVHVSVGVYDLALGCMYEIAHRELRTCALTYTHVRTALGPTPKAGMERSTLLQHLPTTPRSKHSSECST